MRRTVVLGALAARLGVNAGRRAEAKAELERIFNLSSDLIVVADFEGHFTSVNPAVEQILGYTREEFLARPYLELVHPDDRERTAAEAAEIANGRHTLSFENRFRHKDGSFRVLEWTATPVTKDKLMYGVARDITARRRAETESDRLADEQAALRRVATVAAGGGSRGEVFNAIAQEFGGLIDADFIEMLRFEDEHTAVSEASGGAAAEAFRVGSRHELGGENAASLILRTAQPVRIDDYRRAATGPIAEAARSAGLRSAVGTPLIVDDRLWGAMTIGTTGEEPLPADTETRLTEFTELMATAIANTEARGEVERLADEQAALRRVATVVARGGTRREVFNAVAEEMRQLIGADFIDMLRYEDDRTVVSVAAGGVATGAFVVGTRYGLEGDNATSRIHRTGQTVRIDHYDRTATGPIAEAAHPTGLRSVVGTPLIVDDRLWGAVTIGTTGEVPLAPDTEARLEQFTELMATAIANTESREALRQLADEQAALRRMATLVAEGAPPGAMLDAVAGEMEALLDADQVAMNRFEPGEEMLALAHRGADVPRVPPGSRVSTRGESATSAVRRTGRPARMESYEHAEGAIAEGARASGLRSSVAVPIPAEGRELWGVITASWKRKEAPPPNTEERMLRFAQVLATAIANAEARGEIERLADEQAALRRVATVVARGGSRSEVFSAIAEEVRQLIDAELFASVLRYVDDRTVLLVATAGAAVEAFEVGTRHTLGGHNASSLILRTRQPVRIDNYDRLATGSIGKTTSPAGLSSVVATPLIVDDRLWGAVMIGTTGERPLPPETEARLEQFTDLMATAIANTEARAEVERLADEQAALRRVATLVAQGASADIVLDAVAAEMERLLDADAVAVGRYESAEEVTVVAHRSLDPQRAPVGTRMNYAGHNISALVRLTGGPVRLEDLSRARGGFVDVFRGLGAHALVGAPITVAGRLWGAISVGWNSEAPPPADTEERMARFAELLETAIANADSRSQLTASRARLVTAADEARRQVVRDLHDGAQQRLVHTIVTLKLAKRALDNGDGNGDAESLLGEALEQAELSNAELRELAHGILPSVLARGGLRAGVDTVVDRMNLPVDIEVPDRRFPPEVEASAYFVIAEALTNVMKHSQAGSATVTATVDGGSLSIEVRDDGTGGADPGGHGLMGVNDRVTALGGRLDVESPAGGGTLLSATLPLTAD